MKQTFALLLILVACILGQAQTSTHEDNVGQVTQNYWTHLGRGPDAQGLQFWTYQLDTKAKDSKGITQAFTSSVEYQEKTVHLTQCRPDYTKRTDFSSVRYSKPVELISITGKFRGRDLVGTDLDPATGFYGNTINVLSGECLYTLWFDYSSLGIMRANQLTSTLPDSKEITVTY